MGRLCGGAHEISGIKAPLFLHDELGSRGGVGDGVVGYGVVGVVWSMAIYRDRWWVGVVLRGMTWGAD